MPRPLYPKDVEALIQTQVRSEPFIYVEHMRKTRRSGFSESGEGYRQLAGEYWGLVLVQTQVTGFPTESPGVKVITLLPPSAVIVAVMTPVTSVRATDATLGVAAGADQPDLARSNAPIV